MIGGVMINDLCSYHWDGQAGTTDQAALLRFELRLTDSESVVLPLHYRAMSAGEGTRTLNFHVGNVTL